MQYHTVSFVCEVLICANFVRFCRLTDFNSTVTLISWLQLSHYCMCHSPMSCDLVTHCLFTRSSRECTFLLCCSTWSKTEVLILYLFHHDDKYSTFLTVTPSNIIGNMVSSDYRAYCKGLKDSTLDAIVCARQSDLFEVYHSIGIVWNFLKAN